MSRYIVSYNEDDHQEFTILADAVNFAKQHGGYIRRPSDNMAYNPASLAKVNTGKNFWGHTARPWSEDD